MATTTKKSIKEQINIPERTIGVLKVGIVPYNDSQILVHRFSEKAIGTMLDNMMGKAKVKKAPKNPKAEYEAAKYLDKKGRECIRADAVKKSMVEAFSFVDGLTKKLIKGGIFVRAQGRGPGGEPLIPLKYKRRYMNQAPVRIGQGKTDLRYRPCYEGWSAEFEIEFDANVFTSSQVLHLLHQAGFCIGLHEDRPGKSGGDYGRFEVKQVREAAKRAKRKKAA